jgi:hypothetical protein
MTVDRVLTIYIYACLFSSGFCFGVLFVLLVKLIAGR